MKHAIILAHPKPSSFCATTSFAWASAMRVVQKAGFKIDDALASDEGVHWYSISPADVPEPGR